MVVAAIGAACVGQIVDGALLIVIFATSGAMEAYSTSRTECSVRALLLLAPEQASLLASDGTERVIDTAELQVGDVIVVRPGERIGADGRVKFGLSEVDQASITGEPLPVVRALGDEVFAGTLNGQGSLQVEITRAAADSVVARIVMLVAQASATKAKAQLFIEKIEQRYSKAMVASTVLVFAIPMALKTALEPALLRAMTYMIVASPCAIVLATMPPLLAAIANAGRHGVLVKSAIVMEQLGTTSLVAFDKTGTLTLGCPNVTDFVVLLASTIKDDELLALAAGAEQPSEHPLGRAIVLRALEAGLIIPNCTDFSATPGRGVSAYVDSFFVQVGTPAIIDTTTTDTNVAFDIIHNLEARGRTAVVVLVDGRLFAVLGLADQVRPNAAFTVGALTELTGVAPVLLTGDNPFAARLLGDLVGIEDVRAGLLPHGKVAEVAKLGREGARVLVVGDGVNDAPAMAAAQVGVAMGRHGSDLTLQTADAVLVQDDLTTLPAIIALSRRSRGAVVQNLVLGCAAIVGLVAWDLLGHLPLALGVVGHEGGTVLIGLNGLRLLRAHAWKALPENAQDSALTGSS
jgi:heavy metal translocating P-type ATPase